jgi:hypothetical protein
MVGLISNHPAAGKAGIARLLAIEHHCPGLPEPGRSVASQLFLILHTKTTTLVSIR